MINSELLLRNAEEKLRREMKSEDPTKPETMIQGKVAEALIICCRQDKQSAGAAETQKQLEQYKAQAEQYKAEKESAVSKIGELEKKLSIESSAETVKFTFYFDAVQKDVNNILSALSQIKGKDSETAEKYSAAFAKYLKIVSGELQA